MENNRTKKTLPAEIVFAKGLSSRTRLFLPLYMPIWAHHHAVPMCITTMWMHNMQHHATLLGARLDKAGANRKWRCADDPPHHSITYRYRITYTYQSRGHSLANIEVHKMKVPKQTIGTLRAFGGLAGGLKCSWVRTWNIRREQYFYIES